jgi:hypothetical protein
VLIWQIINAIVIYSWLGGVLFFLWRHALGGGAHVHRLHMLLNETTQHSVEAANKSAEAAQEAAQAAHESAQAVSNLAEILRKRNA